MCPVMGWVGGGEVSSVGGSGSGVAASLQSFGDTLIFSVSVRRYGADPVCSSEQGACHCNLVGKGVVG